MSELIVLVVGAAAAFVVWRGMKVRAGPHDFMVAVSGFSSEAGRLPADVHQWPHLGRYDFAVSGTALHQAALRSALEQLSEHCVATLHSGGRGFDTGAPVEVRIEDARVGFLSDGDATRFHRRLAYEGRPGQLSQCDARIVLVEGSRPSDRRAYTILLDLKPFRH